MKAKERCIKFRFIVFKFRLTYSMFFFTSENQQTHEMKQTS